MPPTTAPATTSLERLAEQVAQAGARARAMGQPVLVSVVEEMPACDPLTALETAAARASTRRMYWARPADGTAFAAIGETVAVEPRGAGRFRDADREWQALMSSAVIDDPSGGADGAGPLLVGGFAFDEMEPRDRRWQDFPIAGLFVPRLQLAATGGRHWLTTTLLALPDGTTDIEAFELDRLREAFLAGSPPDPEGLPSTVRFTDELPPDEWKAHVMSALAEIRIGALQKVVLARARRADSTGPIDALRVLRHLGDAHPHCHVFGCWRGESVFLGASPERLVRLQGDRVSSSSLAGSAPRGATGGEDGALSAALLTSSKDRAEHAMVRDALCAALAGLCDDVEASDEPALFTLPHVHHLHTAIHARLRGGHSLLDLVDALHPTPAVGGAPRGAALAYIREHEPLDRGWYAAPVGWIGRDRGEFAVALRSALVRGHEAWLFAGCGIVAGSDPAAEYAETLLKLLPMEQALAPAGAAG